MQKTPLSENFHKLIGKLRELFQLHRGDLDFGLYRVMNYKSAEVDKFLNQDLLPQVRAAFAAAENAYASMVQDRGTDFAELEAAAKAAAEADVYNHLYIFFARYYSEGDFMPLRRYRNRGQEVYLIPYNGEEVKLHWANADQYYVKTTENYAAYLFTVDTTDGKRRVRFEIAKADSEKDNIVDPDDKKRRFILATDAVAMRGDDLNIQFEHRPLSAPEKAAHPGNKQQDSLNQAAEKAILAALKKTAPAYRPPLAADISSPNDAPRTRLAKHLATYTAKNSFDYFIHKDLGGFLRRELDFYLKNNVLFLDDLDTPQPSQHNWHAALTQMRIIRMLGHKLIDFIAQLEDFQKQLWLKKKFILATHYALTLDRVPPSLYPDIAKNPAQVAEWVELFAIDQIQGDLADQIAYSTPPTPQFLSANPHLVLDTRHFDPEFTHRLLAALSESTTPLDDQLDGLLIHGENFQALNLLQKRYRRQVRCIHIDPPYNTDTSGFVYKNNYRHSSWLAMMQDRIFLSLSLVDHEGSLLCHIDENEYENLYTLLDNIMLFDTGTIIWDKRNPMNAGRGVANQHEYIIWRSVSERPIYINNKSILSILQQASELITTAGKVTEQVKKEFRQRINQNPDLTNGEKAYRHLDDQGRVYRSVSLRAPEPRQDQKFYKPLIHPITGKSCPVPPNGFSRTPETLQKMLTAGLILFGTDETTQPQEKKVLLPSTQRQLSSVIQDAKSGKAYTGPMGIEFPYCHPVSLYETLFGASVDKTGLVLDYFAGSGTTGHAVLNLNREDNGNRKYILVEVGHHFDTVLLPRLKKVIYSKDWKDGKPVTRDGLSQFIKYVRLESYEDTLDSLEVNLPTDDLFTNHPPEFKETYHLRYALGKETATSASLVGKNFIRPEGYTLSVVRDGNRQDHPVDLVETFNHLLGLKLTTRQYLDTVLTLRGTNPTGHNILILWRNQQTLDNPTLEHWFTHHYTHLTQDQDIIYLNGSHNLESLKRRPERWVAYEIEVVFRQLMFEQ